MLPSPHYLNKNLSHVSINFIFISYNNNKYQINCKQNYPSEFPTKLISHFKKKNPINNLNKMPNKIQISLPLQNPPKNFSTFSMLVKFHYIIFNVQL